MMFREKITWSTVVLFLAVVASSSLFRITNLDLIEFKADEAINLFLASRPIFGHPLSPGGTVSSVGLLNPPLLNYLLFPLTLISLDPKVISFFIGLLNSLAIGFFFLLIKRYYGLTTALIASFLFAFSPWAILFSRKIWAQDLLLPFLILLLYSSHQIMIEKKMIYWTTYTASALFLIQLHQSAIIFLFLISGFLLINQAKINLAYIALGVFLGLLPMIPYLAYIINNLRSNSRAFLVAKERFGRQYFPITFFRPLQISSQGGFHFVLGDDTLTFADNFPLIYKLRQFFYLEYFLLPFGGLIFWKKFTQFRFLVYTALGLPFIYFLLHFEPFIHYFIVLAPLLFLFLATAFSFLLNLNRPIFRTASLLTLIGLISIAIAFNAAFFNLLSEQKGLKGDYGTVFAVIEEKAKESLRAYQNDEAYQEMLLASYLTKDFFHGDLPLAKMIYSPVETKKNLLSLEKRLNQVPEDARVQNELLAFYTSSPLTRETIKLLKAKSQNLPGYKIIYNEVYEIFLEQNP